MEAKTRSIQTRGPNREKANKEEQPIASVLGIVEGEEGDAGQVHTDSFLFDSVPGQYLDSGRTKGGSPSRRERENDDD